MPTWKPHEMRLGNRSLSVDDAPSPLELKGDVETWIATLIQSEHLSLLVGNGLTLGICSAAGISGASMNTSPIPSASGIEDLIGRVSENSSAAARASGRGEPNVEDQLRACLVLLSGLEALNDSRASGFRTAVEGFLADFLGKILQAERHLATVFDSNMAEALHAQRLLVSFLLSLSGRPASRERLNVFTLNYDRLFEYGCDLAGLRVLDRFVGLLTPTFRSSRIDVDFHYNPPGIRGEPRYLEGVVRFTKLHGSVDWIARRNEIRRTSLPFGAPKGHPGIPASPVNTVMVYPNATKDVETFDYPYAELHRDFASAICRPQSAVLTYGYSFGDDHVNRVLSHMLTIPSTHLLAISYDDLGGRIERFWESTGRSNQMSVLLGSVLGNLSVLVGEFLPRPAIDPVASRLTNANEVTPQSPVAAPEDPRGGDAD
jgi:hypothetical protein